MPYQHEVGPGRLSKRTTSMKELAQALAARDLAPGERIVGLARGEWHSPQDRVWTVAFFHEYLVITEGRFMVFRLANAEDYTTSGSSILMRPSSPTPSVGENSKLITYLVRDPETPIFLPTTAREMDEEQFKVRKLTVGDGKFSITIGWWFPQDA